MKWITLGLLVAAVAIFMVAMRWNDSASFEGGSFIGVILLFVLSGALALGAVGMFGVLLFMAL